MSLRNGMSAPEKETPRSPLHPYGAIAHVQQSACVSRVEFLSSDVCMCPQSTVNTATTQKASPCPLCALSPTPP